MARKLNTDNVGDVEAHAALLEDMNELREYMIEEGDKDRAEEIYFHYRRAFEVNLPTGVILMFVNHEYGTVQIPHTLFLEHGVRWTSRHDPDRVALVGGSAPF